MEYFLHVTLYDEILFLDTEGNVWYSNNDSFCKHPNLNNIVHISCSREEVYCVTSSGEVVGFNLADKEEIYKIDGVKNIVNATLGFESCLFLDVDGNVFGKGINLMGELGVRPKGDAKPVSIMDIGQKNVQKVIRASQFTIFQYFDHEIKICGALNYLNESYPEIHIPQKLFNERMNVEQVSCGDYHALFLIDGGVYSLGLNTTGQLGLGILPNAKISSPKKINIDRDFVYISTGTEHSMILDQNRNLWTFGNNLNGQLGLGDFRDRFYPQLVNDLDYVILLSYGGCITIAKTISGVYISGEIKRNKKTARNNKFINMEESYNDIISSSIPSHSSKSAKKI